MKEPPLSEFDVIRRYFDRPAHGAILGVGDDAAIVRVSTGADLVISADMLVAGRHFLPDADPLLLGHKSLAVNLSDMAAMGATPRWATLAIALPRIDPKWLGAFARGFMSLARRHGVDLIGGDTTRGPLTISVQIMGEVARGKALRRDGAKAGDEIWVSGRVGEAALSLAVIGRRIKVGPREWSRFEQRLNAPQPRIALGVELRGIARSAIDISDGLLADLGHICERSKVAAVIEWDRVPLSPLMRDHADRRAVMEAALAGGDDYELCFTAPRARRGEVERAGRESRVPVTRIGRIVRSVRGKSLVDVVDSAGKAIALGRKGYDHFS